jgi:hypothetical protein
MKGEQSNAVQKAFAQAQSNSAEIMQKNARAISDQQSEILNFMGNFAYGWFKRRHVGVQAAAEASERMCQASTPQACFAEYQAWASGALERAITDGVEYQRELGKLMTEFVPVLDSTSSPTQASGTQTEPGKRTRVSEAA